MTNLYPLRFIHIAHQPNRKLVNISPSPLSSSSARVQCCTHLIHTHNCIRAAENAEANDCTQNRMCRFSLVRSVASCLCSRSPKSHRLNRTHTSNGTPKRLASTNGTQLCTTRERCTDNSIHTQHSTAQNKHSTARTVHVPSYIRVMSKNSIQQTKSDSYRLDTVAVIRLFFLLKFQENKKRRNRVCVWSCVQHRRCSFFRRHFV